MLNRRRFRTLIALAAVALSGLAVTAVSGTATAASTAGISNSSVSKASGEVVASAVPVGTYRIRNMARPGDCLRADPSTAPEIGTRIAMWPCDDGIHQRWIFGSANPDFPPGFREVRNGSGRCLDAHDRSGVVNGNIIHLFNCNKSANQAWAFSEPPGSGVVCLWRAPDCDKVLDQQLELTEGLGYRVHLWRNHGEANQDWFVERVS